MLNVMSSVIYHKHLNKATLKAVRLLKGYVRDDLSAMMTDKKASLMVAIHNCP